MKVQQVIHSVATYVAARHLVTVAATSNTPTKITGSFSTNEQSRRLGVVVSNQSATNRIYIQPRNVGENAPTSSHLTSALGAVHIIEPLMDRAFEYSYNVELYAVADASTDIVCLPYFE